MPLDYCQEGQQWLSLCSPAGGGQIAAAAREDEEWVRQQVERIKPEFEDHRASRRPTSDKKPER